jgi:hypothetical protein
MLPLIPIISVLLAIASDEIRRGRRPKPYSATELVVIITELWDEEQHGSTLNPAAISQIEDFVQQLWDQSGQMPEHIPWGELVEDPFIESRKKNQKIMELQHQYEQAEALALQWPTDQSTDKIATSIGSSISDPRIAFSDIRRDQRGWYVVDNGTDPILGQLMDGDEIGDINDMSILRGVPSRKYWRVVVRERDLVRLVPTGNNPLVSGILAGGGQITESDLRVLSGEEEHRATSWRTKAITEGDRRIDTAKYLLLGTCPTHFGPNGAQGGWYNPADTWSSRGAKLGLSPEEIIAQDAAWLYRYGFPVPASALELPPTISVRAWTKWIEGPSTSDAEILVPSVSGYLTWMRERGITEERLAKIARKISREALETWLDRKLLLFLRDRDEYERQHPYGGDTLMEVVDRGVCALEDQATALAAQRAYDTVGEDSSVDLSVQQHLYHPERRVSVRNALLAVDRAAIGTVYPSYAHWRDILMDWLRWGQSDWLAYEQAIVFAREAKDIGMLEVGAKLPDETNRTWALSALSKLDHQRALTFMADEQHPKVLWAIISGPEVEYGDKDAKSADKRRRIHEFHDYVLQRVLRFPPPVPAKELTWDELSEKMGWEDMLKTINSAAHWAQWRDEVDQIDDAKVQTVARELPSIIEERWPRK